MTALFPVLFLAAISLFAADDSLSGNWQVRQNIAGNESEQACTFTQTGPELSGSCESTRGKVQITGKVQEKKITWSYKSEYNGTPLTVNYTGTLESGKISGTVTVPEFSADGDFTATQSKQ